MDDFCIFVISHQRAGDVMTIDALRKAGYTGEVFVVVDDGDPELEKYEEEYKEKLRVFSKDEYEPNIDLGDNFDGQQTPLYAREAVWDFAKAESVSHFMVMDDDYDWFRHRINEQGNYIAAPPWVKDMDAVLEAMVEYIETAPIMTLAFSQAGDWIGGPGNTHADKVSHKRKAMNAFLCKTDRPFSYLGRLNDDVNTYVRRGNIGEVFLTYMPLCLNQQQTQDRSGGITEAYLEMGTYVKSFYTVMYAPSCAEVSMMGENSLRAHHRISWDNAVPKILPERYQKSR